MMMGLFIKPLVGDSSWLKSGSCDDFRLTIEVDRVDGDGM